MIQINPQCSSNLHPRLQQQQQVRKGVNLEEWKKRYKKKPTPEIITVEDDPIDPAQQTAGTVGSDPSFQLPPGFVFVPLPAPGFDVLPPQAPGVDILPSQAQANPLRRNKLKRRRSRIFSAVELDVRPDSTTPVIQATIQSSANLSVQLSEQTTAPPPSKLTKYASNMPSQNTSKSSHKTKGKLVNASPESVRPPPVVVITIDDENEASSPDPEPVKLSEPDLNPDHESAFENTHEIRHESYPETDHETVGSDSLSAGLNDDAQDEVDLTEEIGKDDSTDDPGTVDDPGTMEDTAPEDLLMVKNLRMRLTRKRQISRQEFNGDQAFTFCPHFFLHCLHSFFST